MDTCRCNGRQLCAYDLKDINGIYNSEMVEDWKKKSSSLLLRCEECNFPVYLGAGPIKEPYFAHFDKKECSYSSLKESEASKKSKRLIFSILKRSFPNYEVSFRYKLGDVFITAVVLNTDNPQRIIASVDFRIQNLPINQFEKRSEFYNNNGLKPLYIIGLHNIGSNNQFVWYLNMIQKVQDFALMLDQKTEKLMVYYRYESYGRVKLVDVFKEVYDTSDIMVNEQNDVIISNTISIRSQLKEFIDDRKRRVERLRREKEIKDQNKGELSLRREQELSNERERIVEQLKLNVEEAGLDYNILKNAMNRIMAGEEYLVSKKYKDYIYSNKLM